jgi:phospholipid/cholesterol/gamma-HCH transport system substrate-binding protein
MTARNTLSMVRHRLLGVAFLAVMALLIGMSIQVYQQAFTTVVPVTLRTDHIGNQLQPASDVKVRGLIVGQVKRVTSRGDHAEVELALQPDKVGFIPRNVSARLLPKTLFGERYVSLVVPNQASSKRLGSGDVISQDNTTTAMELERVFSDLMPLLQAVEPQKLASTLNALSGALDGRGKPLGDTLVRLNHYVEGLNPSLPNFNTDVKALSEFANTYSTAAPDLVQALSDLTTTSKTLVDTRSTLNTLYGSVTTASNDLTSFLQANQSNLIQLSAASRPVLDLLAKYSPEYPCFLKNLSDFNTKIGQAFGVGTNQPGLHVTLKITQNRGKYEPNKDNPAYSDTRGPRCYDVSKPGIFPQYPADGPVKDGTTPKHVNGPGAASTLPATGASSTSPQAASRDLGLPNSPQEGDFIASLMSVTSGVAAKDVPQWSSLLMGPVLRGAEVSVS